MGSERTERAGVGRANDRIVRARAKIGCRTGLHIRRLVRWNGSLTSMKTVESSAVFQPKQWAEKEAGKTI